MKAIFAGTFDPFTLGHRRTVERAKKLFGEVVIAVAADTGKNTAPFDKRIAIAKAATADLIGVSVEGFGGLLTEYVKKKGECVLVRGVRNAIDLEYERELTRAYMSLGGVDAVFLISNADVEHISSTVVRSIAAFGGAIDGYVVKDTEDIIKGVYGNSAE